MMLASFLLGFSAYAFAATSSSSKATWVSGLTHQLTDMGLDTLSSLIQSSINSESSNLWNSLGNIDQLQGTLIAPNDAAWAGFNTSDAEQLAATLALHFLAGSHDDSESKVATSPAHTVAHSFLTDLKYSNLPDQLGQAVILSVVDGVTQVLNQQGGPELNVTQTAKYAALDILVVGGLIALPLDWEVILPDIGLQVLYNVATDLVEDVGAWLSLPGVTVFAPIDAALSDVISSVGKTISTNATISGVLHNHFVNGTSLYSDQFGNGPWVSGGGQNFTFNKNSTGTWVTLGNVTANVTHSDIPFMNGVIHIIDQVLFDPVYNPAAAAAGYAANQASASYAAYEATATASLSTQSNGAFTSSKSAMGAEILASIMTTVVAYIALLL